MLPETALVKLMWVLGNATGRKDVRELMENDLKGECNRRSYNGL